MEGDADAVFAITAVGVDALRPIVAQLALPRHELIASLDGISLTVRPVDVGVWIEAEAQTAFRLIVSSPVGFVAACLVEELRVVMRSVVQKGARELARRMVDRALRRTQV